MLKAIIFQTPLNQPCTLTFGCANKSVAMIFDDDEPYRGFCCQECWDRSRLAADDRGKPYELLNDVPARADFLGRTPG